MANSTVPMPLNGIRGKVITNDNTLNQWKLSLNNGSRYLIIGTGANPRRCYAIIVVTYQSGLVNVHELSRGGDISFDTSVNNVLTINSATSGGTQLMIMTMYNDIEDINLI